MRARRMWTPFRRRRLPRQRRGTPPRVTGSARPGREPSREGRTEGGPWRSSTDRARQERLADRVESAERLPVDLVRRDRDAADVLDVDQEGDELERVDQHAVQQLRVRPDVPAIWMAVKDPRPQ